MANPKTDKTWSDLEVQRLRDELRLGTPIPRLAEFLMRDVDDIEGKIAELAARRIAE
jgi:hypothetical protein